MQILTVGAVELELLTRSGDFIGFGEIRHGDVVLRSASEPLTVRLETPKGILYPRLKLAATTETGDGVDLVLKAHGYASERGEYGDDYGQSILWTANPTEQIVDDVVISLRPAAREIGDRHYDGFSYQVAFSSKTREIHRMLVRGTWELGGAITGNTVLQQGQCNMPVYEGAKETLFTTACLRTLPGYGKTNGYSFQLGPRAGLIQGFDFQYHRDLGILLQAWPQFDSISSLLESPLGSDLLYTYDECRFPLTNQAVSPAKQVLFSAGAVADHQARDAWWDALEQVYGDIREGLGVAPSRVVPEFGIEVPSILDGKLSRVVPGKGWQITEVDIAGGKKAELHLWIRGEAYHHTKALHGYADKVLPQLAKQGVRRFFPVVVSASDVTELGLKRKLDGGYHGELHCASVCATHRFFPSDYWGGIEGWRYLADRAHELGVEIGSWFAPHFSPRSPYFKEHPKWRMIDGQGLPAGGGYGFHSIVVADWNSGIYERTLQDLRQWKEQGGLDFLFIDSYSNMGMLQANYTEKMRTNYRAFGRLLADFQKLGIRSFSFESVSALGNSRFGLTDIRGDRIEQNRAVAGQNDLGWWIGHEDMAYNCWLGSEPRGREEHERMDLLFRLIANCGYIQFQDAMDDDYMMPEWIGTLSHAANAVNAELQGTRRLLRDDAGVTWIHGDSKVIFTYQPIARPSGKIEVIYGEPVTGSQLPAKGIYRVRD